MPRMTFGMNLQIYITIPMLGRVKLMIQVPFASINGTQDSVAVNGFKRFSLSVGDMERKVITSFRFLFSKLSNQYGQIQHHRREEQVQKSVMTKPAIPMRAWDISFVISIAILAMVILGLAGRATYKVAKRNVEKEDEQRELERYGEQQMAIDENGQAWYAIAVDTTV